MPRYLTILLRALAPVAATLAAACDAWSQVSSAAPVAVQACDKLSTLYDVGGLCIENKINLSLITTIVLFFLGYAITRWIERLNKRRARRIYLLALLQEVKLNVDNLATAINLFPPANELQIFIRSSVLNGVAPRPFITFNLYSIIFKTRTEILQDLEEGLVGNIIEFYGRLDGISIDISAIDKKAYDTISLNGRDSIFADLKRDIEICHVIGKNVDSGVRLYLKLT